jgi:hypothetical protein
MGQEVGQLHDRYMMMMMVMVMVMVMVMMMMMMMMMMTTTTTSVTHCWTQKMCDVCSSLKCFADTRANKHYRNSTGGTGECFF